MKDTLQPPISLLELLEPYEQKYNWSCGSASLLVCYRAYGIKITEDEIIKESFTDEEGMSWQQMREHVDSMGFKPHHKKYASYDTLLNTLVRTQSPTIVCWMSDRDGEDGAHFSVVKTMTPDSISILDPAFGDMHTMNRWAFEEKWMDQETHNAFLTILLP